MQSANERAADLRALAKRLQFAVEQSSGRFTLTRTADVSRPVREENLSLAEAEELLETWKLRGLQGGLSVDLDTKLPDALPLTMTRP